jgi:hypothetical protein
MSNKYVPAVKVGGQKPVPAVKVGSKKNTLRVMPRSAAFDSAFSSISDNISVQRASKIADENPLSSKNSYRGHWAFESQLVIGMPKITYIGISFCFLDKSDNKDVRIIFGRKGNTIFDNQVFTFENKNKNGSNMFCFTFCFGWDVPSYSGPLKLTKGYYPNYGKWKHSFYPDCFDNIKLKLADSSGGILIYTVFIVFNNLCILYENINQELNINHDIILDSFILKTKNKIVRGRRKMDGWEDIPEYNQTSPNLYYSSILLVALGEYGKGWSSKYYYDYDPPTFSNGFCAWVIWQVRGGIFYTYDQLINNYRYDNLWISSDPTDLHFVPYVNLSSIRPGYLVKFNNRNINYSSIFIDWSDSNGNLYLGDVKIEFNPKSNINFFRTIEMVDRVVSINVHSVGIKSDLNPDLVWGVGKNKNIPEYITEIPGFAITNSGYPRPMPTPFLILPDNNFQPISKVNIGYPDYQYHIDLLNRLMTSNDVLTEDMEFGERDDE